MAKQSTKGVKGVKRDEKGRFLPGTRGGKGNPFAAQVNRLRSALLNAVSEKDVIEVVHALLDTAKGGDVAASKVLFDRVLGKPLEADILERIEALEKQPEV